MSLIELIDSYGDKKNHHGISLQRHYKGYSKLLASDDEKNHAAVIADMGLIADDGFFYK